MSKKKEKYVPATEVNNVDSKVHRARHEEKQKDKGEKVVLWIFIVLIVLAIIYVAWTLSLM